MLHEALTFSQGRLSLNAPAPFIHGFAKPGLSHPAFTHAHSHTRLGPAVFVLEYIGPPAAIPARSTPAPAKACAGPCWVLQSRTGA